MQLHQQFPEKVMRELTMWYQTTLCLMSVVLVTIATAQWYTLHVTRRMQKKCALTHIAHRAVQDEGQKLLPLSHDSGELAYIFAEICNRLPVAIHLTRLMIKPRASLSFQGIIQSDPQALTALLTMCTQLGFPHVTNIKNVPAVSASMKFEVSVHTQQCQKMQHNMVYL